MLNGELWIILTTYSAKKIETIKEQIKREPFSHFPTLKINELRENINDYKLDDFEIINYNYHEKLTGKMIV